MVSGQPVEVGQHGNKSQTRKAGKLAQLEVNALTGSSDCECLEMSSHDTEPVAPANSMQTKVHLGHPTNQHCYAPCPGLARVVWQAGPAQVAACYVRQTISSTHEREGHSRHYGCPPDSQCGNKQYNDIVQGPTQKLTPASQASSLSGCMTAVITLHCHQPTYTGMGFSSSCTTLLRRRIIT